MSNLRGVSPLLCCSLSYRLPVIITRTSEGEFDITWDYEVGSLSLSHLVHGSLLQPEPREGLRRLVVWLSHLPTHHRYFRPERPVYCNGHAHAQIGGIPSVCDIVATIRDALPPHLFGHGAERAVLQRLLQEHLVPHVAWVHDGVRRC